MHSVPIRTASPERAVPAGRIGYDLDAEILLLHTIQTGVAFTQLLTTGVLRAEPEHVASEWPEAYHWMYRMMAERLPTFGNTALWLWARIRRHDLVSNCRRARGAEEPHVLLTCRIPRERVLLTQYDEWHAALNSTLAIPPRPAESEEEYNARFDELADDFTARLEAAGARNQPLHRWPDDLRAEAEESWESILDPSNFNKHAYWQGTVHEIRADDVVDAVRILH
jgi:hypothetical protein